MLSQPVTVLFKPSIVRFDELPKISRMVTVSEVRKLVNNNIVDDRFWSDHHFIVETDMSR